MAERCKGCRRLLCTGKRCPRWRAEYLGRQALIQDWAWRQQDTPLMRQVLRYEGPDRLRQAVKEGPCGSCVCSRWCEKPCRTYLGWYDARMALARKELGYGG